MYKDLCAEEGSIAGKSNSPGTSKVSMSHAS